MTIALQLRGAGEKKMADDNPFENGHKDGVERQDWVYSETLVFGVDLNY